MTVVDQRWRRAAAWLGAPLLAFLGLTAAASRGPRPLLINETPSVPPGLYRRVLNVPAVGEFVAVSQPKAAKTYLASLAVPADMPLLKRVAAVKGDLVCQGRGGLSASGRYAPRLQHDRRGARLAAWSGCRILAADEFVVLGDSATSFDSRYFGPVRREDLQGVYRPVIQW